MTFVLNMARRELRASGFRLLVFFLCMAIGVAAVVALQSFTDSMKAAIARDARALVAADVRGEMNGEWSPRAQEVFERYAKSPVVTAHTWTIDTQTMVRPVKDTSAAPVMVALRAVQPAFPFYGNVRLSGGGDYSHALLRDRGVIVSTQLATRMQIVEGDTLKIGTLPFTVRGLAERIPGNGLDFSPLPVVLVDYPDVAAAKLTGFGSRVYHACLFRTLEGRDEELAQSLSQELRTVQGIDVGSFRFVENWLDRSAANIDGFLSLIGLAMLTLGGIGVASVTRVFVQQRLKTIAVLKCLGGRNRRVLGAYVVQVVLLSLVGGLLGVALAAVVTRVGLKYVAPHLPFDIVPVLSTAAIVQGLIVGTFVAMLFALPALLEVRRVKPILVLRQDSSSRRGRIDWLRIVAVALPAAGLLALAAWQSGSYRYAGRFVGSMAATALVLNLAGSGVIWMLRRARGVRSFTVRHGISSLYRPGNQTNALLFTLGLGALCLVSVRLQQVAFLREYSLDRIGLTGDMFLADVQRDQQEQAAREVEALKGSELELVPVVRARLVGLRRLATNTRRVPGNRVRGEHRVSYRASLSPDEAIAEGQFWDSTPAANAEVSVAANFASWLELGIGDTLIFELSGRRIESRVTSIRTITRRARLIPSLAQFDFVFRPGVLESAPHTLVGVFKGPAERSDRGRLQNTFMDRFPNVTVVDAVDEIDEVRKRIAEASFAVSVLGVFVLACGGLILIGSIAMTRLQRIYESAILKTLGAKTRFILLVTVVEYGVLGLLAGAIGSTAAIGLTWTMSTQGRRRVPWEFEPTISVLGAVATVVLVAAVGVAASWGVITRKPMGILREEG
jgi:putative ABC transport system permease protein